LNYSECLSNKAKVKLFLYLAELYTTKLSLYLAEHYTTKHSLYLAEHYTTKHTGNWRSNTSPPNAASRYHRFTSKMYPWPPME
jgi:hypothetical protein